MPILKGMTSTTAVSCRVVADSDEAAALVREALALVFPDAAPEVVTSGATGASNVALDAAREAIAKARRAIAAGELALGLQHAMNNPLTAVLAEAQLLAMEPLPAEAQGAVGRIVENTRRLVAIVRKLDAVAPRPAR